jgi:heat shock protein HslJ
VVGTISDGRTVRLPVRMTPPRLDVRKDGTARVDTGCNTGRTVVRVDGDTLVFGPTSTTRMACRQPAREIERRVLEVLDGPSDYVSFDGSVLVVTRAGTGLMVEVR